jgi:hydroxymethylglutaryl-CoA reductase (NADPH)
MIKKNSISIPMKWIGPIKMSINDQKLDLKVPVATYEKTLWPSILRGAKISQQTKGIDITISSKSMTRSIIIEVNNFKEANKIKKYLELNKEKIKEVVSTTSRYCDYLNNFTEIIGNLLYIRLQFNTAEAAGHNMTTKAAQAIQTHLLNVFTKARYVSISGNTCTDKKNSAINSILGRGMNVTAEIIIDKLVCEKLLRCSPKQIVDLNIKKNYIGSILAGSVRSANAHYANILLALFLATGQDAANIVEGSQGITYASVQEENLYFSITIPNIIVGTVGNGKDLDFVNENLVKLGCQENDGNNSTRLAGIIAGATLCSELSLLAAQVNPGELMRAHEIHERNKKK